MHHYVIALQNRSQLVWGNFIPPRIFHLQPQELEISPGQASEPVPEPAPLVAMDTLSEAASSAADEEEFSDLELPALEDTLQDEQNDVEMEE